MTRSIDLFELQETDTAIDAAQRRLNEIAQELESEGGFATLEEQIARFEIDLGEAEREQHTADEAVVDQKDKIGTLETRLYSGEVKLPRELKILQEDVESLQRQLSSQEEQALAAMVRADEVRSALVGGRAERDARLAEREQLVESLGAERTGLEATLEQLQTRRERQKQRVDPPDITLYERLRRARGGRAVSKVERGTCQGCRISLPTTVFQRARSGLKIVQCTSCERILYVS